MKYDFVGVSWYRRKEDYDRVYALAPDGGGMEPTFEEWKRVVELLMPEIKAKGKRIKKIVIDPDDFANWLRINGLRACSARLESGGFPKRFA
jgi:hypothetical protein